MRAIENARGGGQRIDGGVDTDFSERAAEYGGGVKVSEGRGRSRIGQIVGGHVDGLHRGDRTFLGGGDALLQLAHFAGQVGLVAHGRRHAAEEGGNLRAGLGKAENVVDEQQGVGAFGVAEILGHGEAGEGDAETRAGRLGHLAVDERGLGLGGIAGNDDAGLLEFEPEVIALAGALADSGEDRVAAMLLWPRC